MRVDGLKKVLCCGLIPRLKTYRAHYSQWCIECLQAGSHYCPELCNAVRNICFRLNETNVDELINL